MLKSVASTISPFWAVTNLVARQLLLPRAKRLPKPVISVGNIVAGGVGKTEIAAAIAARLVAQGKRVVVASRGYASDWQREGGVAHDFASALAHRFPDESLVILKKAPGVKVAVGADRGLVLEKHWEELNPDVVILDDGFQHFKLARDLDVLVHDFTPRWPILREFPSVLGRVPVRVSLSDVPRIWSGKDWVKAKYRVRGTVNASGKQSAFPKKALLFCGIGNPNRVRLSLKQAGVEVVGTKYFRDHAKYGAREVRGLLEWQNKLKLSNKIPLLTTLKDYVKLLPYLESQGGVAGFEPEWIELSLEFTEGENLLWKKIDETLAVRNS